MKNQNLKLAKSKIEPKSLPPVLCFVGTCHLKLWGMTPAERTRKLFQKQGITEIIDVSDLKNVKSSVILVRADAILDVPLTPAIIDNVGLLLLTNGENAGHPVLAHAKPKHASKAADILLGKQEHAARAGLVPLSPGKLELGYWKKLRKRETPYALLVNFETKSATEWRMFMGTYKGATDFVTKHLWPWPAFFVTRFIAPLHITPNMVTTLSAVFVVLAFFLFLNGSWGLGLLCAWIMTFLDTVDGKLARVTLSSSKWGDIFDHGIDLIHPPFWYAAWGFGLAHSTTPVSDQTLWTCLGIIFAGYIIQRLMEGVSIKFFKLEIHIWRPIDTFFRQITARRNPNMVLMSIAAVFMRPDLGLIAIAVWTLACLILHGLQLVQGYFAFRKHGKLSSWLTERHM